MTPKQFVKLYKRYGSVKAVSRNVEGTYGSILKVYHQAVDDGLMEKQSVGRKPVTSKKSEALPKPVVHGRLRVKRAPKHGVPPKGEVYRYLLTCAQNNTKLNDRVWENGLALAEHYNAEIMVSRFAYNKSAHSKTDKGKFTGKETLYGADDMWWDERILPYMSDTRTEIAPGLVWCGEMNILPTASNPLSAMERYTGRASSIFPHTKRAMESVPSGKNEATKFMYTTGTITARNYIQKKAGLKAEFDHCYGFLLVEVDSDGDWFCRQVDAEAGGDLYDLDVKVSDGVATVDNRLESVLWGDIHVRWLDPTVKELAWGEGGIMDIMDPRHQFFGDVLDFRSRNHHDRKDPFKAFQKYVDRQESVEEEVIEAMEFVRWASARRQGQSICKTIVIDSNHDRAAERWLKEADWREDPVNMEFYMESALAKVRAIKKGDHDFHMMNHWAKKYIKNLSGIQFLQQDESFIICKDRHGGIEMGMHGHLGLNGARGSARGFAKMGRRASVGHAHSARIVDGVCQSGTCSILDMLYNLGPSNWSWSHVFTYRNGRQAIITMWNGKWRAVA